MSDPYDEIETAIQHAREHDDTNVQQQLDQISAGIDVLRENEDPPRPDRVGSVIDELDRLEDDVDDPAEAARLGEARDDLRNLLDDPEHVDTFRDESENGGDE